MSDLTPNAVNQALARFKVGRRAPDVPKEVNDDLETIFKAAKNYANPDRNAATSELTNWLVERLPITIDAPMVDLVVRCADAVVDAALGVKEDEDPLVVTSADGSQTYFRDRTEDE